MVKLTLLDIVELHKIPVTKDFMIIMGQEI